MRVASKFKVGFSVNAFYPGALDTWQSIWKDIKSTFDILYKILTYIRWEW